MEHYFEKDHRGWYADKHFLTKYIADNDIQVAPLDALKENQMLIILNLMNINNILLMKKQNINKNVMMKVEMKNMMQNMQNKHLNFFQNFQCYFVKCVQMLQHIELFVKERLVVFKMEYYIVM